MFLKIFFLVKKYTTSSKYAEGGGGEVALRNGVRASLFESFLVFYISDKIYQIGVLYLKNFHFSLSIFKNGVKRSTDPILHDSRWEGGGKIFTDRKDHKFSKEFNLNAKCVEGKQHVYFYEETNTIFARTY